MVQKIKTVSVSKQENDFLVDNNISATRLLRNKIQEMINFHNNNTSNKELYAKIERLTAMIQRYARYIEKKGLVDDFLKEKD